MVTRRTFIKQSGIALAAVAFTPSCAALSTPKGSNPGIQLFSLRNQIGKDLNNVFRKISETGYKLVETYGFEDGKMLGVEPSAFKKLLDDNNLKSPSGHYGADNFFSKTGKADYLKPLLENCNTLGHEYLTIAYLGEPIRTNKEDYLRIAEKMNHAGELCKAAGLKFAYHNHDFEFKQHGADSGYEILLKNTDPNLVSYELDLYWVVRAGKDPIDLFKKYPGRFNMWHVKDMDKANPSLNTEIGTGSINFKSIFEEAKLAGLKYYFVEQENFKIDPYKSIRESYNYVTKSLA